MKSAFILMPIAALLCSCAAPRSTDIAGRAGSTHALARGGKGWPANETSTPQLRGLLWRVPGLQRGVIVCLHGIQTHSAWFGPLAAELNRRGWTVFAPDRRGSGLNADLPFYRGHTTGSEELLDDLHGQMKLAAAMARGRPVILLGTSWGSNLASDYVASTREPKANGLVQLVPATEVQPCFKPSGMKKLGMLLLDVFHPTRTVELPFKADHYLAGADQAKLRTENPPRFACAEPVTDDPALRSSNVRLSQVLSQDKVLLHQPTVRTLVTGQKLARRWPKTLAKSRNRPPILLIIARRDRIMDNVGALSALDRSSAVTMAEIGGGHGIQLTHPGAISEIVAKWAQTNR